MNSNIIPTIQSWLDETGLSQADIARRTKKTTGAISMIFSGQRKPSAELLVAIAKACGKLPEDALQLAGLLPPISEAEEDERLINHLYNTLKTPAAKRQARDYLRFISDQEKQGVYKENAKDQDRPPNQA